MRAVVAAVLGDEELKRRVDSVLAPGEAATSPDTVAPAQDAAAPVPAPAGSDPAPLPGAGEAGSDPSGRAAQQDGSPAAAPREGSRPAQPMSGTLAAPQIRSWTGAAPPDAPALAPPPDAASTSPRPAAPPGRPRPHPASAAPPMRVRRRRSSALLPGLLAPADVPEDAPGRVEFITPTVPVEEPARTGAAAAAVQPAGAGSSANGTLDHPAAEEVLAMQPRPASDLSLWLPVGVLALVLLAVFVLGMALTR